MFPKLISSESKREREKEKFEEISGVQCPCPPAAAAGAVELLAADSLTVQDREHTQFKSKHTRV